MHSRKHPSPPFPAQPIRPPGEEAEMDPAPQYEAPQYRAADKLTGKRAFVTGGDSGIGRAVAVLFAREGADVAFTYLPEEQRDADRTREEVERHGRRCVPIAGDLCDPAFSSRAVETAVEQLGGLDIVVNNAAYQRHLGSFEEVDPEQWDRTFKTNVYAYYYVVRAALPHLSAGSSIIQTGSVVGLEGAGELIDYASTKGAIHAFTKSLAQSLVGRGIRVNCVAPGPVWTPLNPAERSEEDTRTFGESVPMHRPAQPEEIAPAYVYFASEADSSYVSGEVLALWGGKTHG
ncbi:MAG: SDR family oxidoreductase [Sandaracinaceae bacterium]